jgi:hypothetical protein
MKTKLQMSAIRKATTVPSESHCQQSTFSLAGKGLRKQRCESWSLTGVDVSKQLPLGAKDQNNAKLFSNRCLRSVQIIVPS